jgi:hypothetical protein
LDEEEESQGRRKRGVEVLKKEERDGLGSRLSVEPSMTEGPSNCLFE